MDPLKVIQNQDKGRPSLKQAAGVPVFVPPDQPAATSHVAPRVSAMQRELEELVGKIRPVPSTVEGVTHAAKIVAALAAVSRIIPHPAAKVAGVLLAGLHRDPVSGQVRPGPGVGLNFLPAPLGYVDAQAYGIERDFLYPAGITRIIPEPLDAAGFGTREARAADAADAINRILADAVRFEQLTRDTDSYRLEQFLSGRAPGFDVLQSSRYDLTREERQSIIRAELARRTRRDELLALAQGVPVADAPLGGSPRADVSPLVSAPAAPGGASAALGATIPAGATGPTDVPQEPSGGGGGFGSALMSYAPDP